MDNEEWDALFPLQLSSVRYPLSADLTGGWFGAILRAMRFRVVDDVRVFTDF